MTNRKTAIIRKVTAVTIWLFIVCFGCLIVIYPWVFTTIFTSIPLFISLPVIGFCDISVLRALKKTDPSGKSNIHPQKKRALRTIINSFVLTFTAYLPPALIFSLGHNLPLSFDVYYCVLIFIAISSTVSGGVIMPVLYLDSIGQLRIQNIIEKIKMGRWKWNGNWLLPSLSLWFYLAITEIVWKYFTFKWSLGLLCILFESI